MTMPLLCNTELCNTGYLVHKQNNTRVCTGCLMTPMEMVNYEMGSFDERHEIEDNVAGRRELFLGGEAILLPEVQ